MSATILTTKRVRARKTHTCECCWTVCVQPGQEYVRTTYVSDGRIADATNCDDCESLFPVVWKWAGEPWGDGIGADTFQEWAEEHVDDPTWGERARAHLTRRGIDWEDR